MFSLITGFFARRDVASIRLRQRQAAEIADLRVLLDQAVVDISEYRRRLATAIFDEPPPPPVPTRPKRVRKAPTKAPEPVVAGEWWHRTPIHGVTPEPAPEPPAEPVVAPVVEPAKPKRVRKARVKPVVVPVEPDPPAEPTPEPVVAPKPVAKPAKPRALKAFDFWSIYCQAQAAIVARHGAGWKTKAPFGETVVVRLAPRLCAQRGERGGMVHWSRDWRMPAAQYWPGGALPAGLEVTPDYPRYVPPVAPAKPARRVRKPRTGDDDGYKLAAD